MTIQYLDNPSGTKTSSSKITYLDENNNPPAFGGIQGLKNLAVGGPATYGGTPGSEDVFPMLGQMVGSPLGVLGATGGEVIGNVAQKSIKALRKGDLTPIKQFGVSPENFFAKNPDVAVNAGITGATEGLLRYAPKQFFGQQIGNAAKQGVGKNIGSIADKLQNVATDVNPSDVVGQLDAGVEANPLEWGAAKTSINKTKNVLLGGSPENMPFGKARQLEQQLGRVSKYAGASGHFGTSPTAPGLNETLQDTRSMVSQGVDEAAANAGHPEWSDLSHQYSDLSEKYPNKKLDEGAKLWPTLSKLGVAAGSFGSAALSSHPLIGIPLGVASLAESIPQVYRTAMFNSLNRPVISPIARALARGVRIGSSELLRDGDYKS